MPANRGAAGAAGAAGVDADGGFVFRGQCHCGAVRLKISHPLPAPINCHCGLCRRLSGAAFTTWVSVKKSAFKVKGKKSLSSYQPTRHLTRHFCAHCGCHVHTLDERYPDIAGVLAGSLEGAGLEPPQADYFVDDKADWYWLPNGARCFGGTTGVEPLHSYSYA